MKLSPSNPATKKIMRVASMAAGAAGLGAAFMPAQAALANTAPGQPYKIWVDTRGASVFYVQVCGYKSAPGTPWECTARQVVPFTSNHPAYMGSNWRRGEVRVFMFDSVFHEKSHACNTNNSYYGHLRTGGVSLTHINGTALGLSTAAC